MNNPLIGRLSLYGAGVLVLLIVLYVDEFIGNPSESKPRVAITDHKPGEFHQVRHSGSVDVAGTYDISDLQIPEGEIHALLPRDAIPALTDPELQPLSEAVWLESEDRVVVVAVGDETVLVPLRILDWHEIVNMTVGGEPVAATYCPLCDSASVFSRRLSGEDDVVLEFGVSGALYNSNVLMYDRTDGALWSQLGMRAVSGPHAGKLLDHLPIEVIQVNEARSRLAETQVVTRETGHPRDYSSDPYGSYFASDRLMVPVRAYGEELPAKSLGIGLLVGEKAWFVPQDSIQGELRVETPLGVVIITRAGAGLRVRSAPKGVQSAQTFYFSWSSFYPETEIIGLPAVNQVDSAE